VNAISPVQFLVDHGLMLLLGCTAMLLITAIAMCLTSSPLHRQRTGEFGMFCVLAWIIVACIPMHRWRIVERIVRESPAVLPIVGADSAFVGFLSLPGDREVHAMVVNAQAPSVGANPENPKTSPIKMEPIKPPTHSIDVMASLAAIYLCCMVLCAAWLGVAHFLLWRLLNGATTPQVWLSEMMGGVAQESAFAGRVRLAVTDRNIGPFSCGLWRPVIMLSRQTALTSDRDGLRQVLRHELAHVIRKDAVGNALFNLAMLVFYFHPVYWFIRRQAFLARELIADDFASHATDRYRYASDLLALAESRLACHPRRLESVAMFIFTNQLARRITMLVGRRKSLAMALSVQMRAAFLVAGIALLATTSGAIGLQRAVATDDRPNQATSPPDRNAAKSPAPVGDQRAIEIEAQYDPIFFAKLHLDQAANSKEPSQQAGETQTQSTAPSREERAIYQRAQLQSLQAKQAKAAADFDIRELQIEMDTSKARLEKDKVDLARIEGLYQKHASSSGAVEEAQLQVRIDELKLASAQNRLDRVVANRNAKEPVPANIPLQLNPRGELDVVSLANTYANAIGEVRVAQTKLSSAQSQGDRNAMALAGTELKNAMLKSKMLRSIVEVAATHAQSEKERLTQRVNSGVASPSDLADVSARLQMLQLILQTGANTNAGEQPGLNDAEEGRVR
jgi:beta-lactamase regulating signal transducer with metallopeptidase domain